MKSKRIDLLLVEKKLVESREQAKTLIMAGNIYVNGQKINKSSSLVPENSDITIKEKLPYVSRGGIKLESAISYFGITVKDKIVVDIGASTGGFVSCLLKFGAKKIYAVDVGYGQLHYSLRTNPKVINIEKTNARYISKELFEDEIDLITVDVSFISLKKIIPSLKNIIKTDGEILCLIKPQFEAERKYVKKGIVRDENVHFSVIEDISNFCRSYGFNIKGPVKSTIKGADGNIEYFILLSF